MQESSASAYGHRSAAHRRDPNRRAAGASTPRPARPRTGRQTGKSRRWLLSVPADLVVRVELAPERDLRLARHADGLHHRLDLGSHLLEEALEALRVRPLVDDHDLSLCAVEAVRDEAVLLRAFGDGAHRLGILSGAPLELVRIACRTEGHDHRHLEASFDRTTKQAY